MTRLSIKSKLLMMLLGVSLASVAVVVTMAFQSGSDALISSAFQHLTSVRASKAYQIESYLGRVRSQARTLGEDQMIAKATLEFRDAYARLQNSEISPVWDERLDEYYRDEFLPRLQQNVDGSPVFETYRPVQPATRFLQYHYMAANPHPVGEKSKLVDAGDGSRYSAVHSRYHGIFSNLVEEFGYYDMFLIHPKTGVNLYSVFKESDFATSLRDGPYSNTNLAAAAHAISETPDRGTVRMIDFAAYRPSYAAPAAFVAAPIYEGHRHVGTLAFQLPVDEINEIMTGNGEWERDGLGTSGETYLVGPDFKMRSISRFMIEAPDDYAKALRASGVPDSAVSRLLRIGTSILQQEVRTEASVEAMHGASGTKIVDDYRGIPVLSSFSPLELADFSWVILSEIDLDEAYGPVRAFTRRVLITAVALMLVVTILAMWLATNFVRPIRRLSETAQRVAEGGDDSEIESGSDDEFGELAQFMNQMLVSVRTQRDRAEERGRESEDLLLNLLPKAITRRLKAGEENIADAHENVTVLFADVVGFTELTHGLLPKESLELLNRLVSSFDETAEQLGVEKIKTIGDNYMAACGLSAPRVDQAKRTVDLAIEMFSTVRRFNNEHGAELSLRVGIDSGPLVAGVIGRRKLLYDLWGETVNHAAGLRSLADPGEVLISNCVANSVKGLHETTPVQRDGSAGPVFSVRIEADDVITQSAGPA